MITRIWHGRTRERDANGYLQFLIGKGTSDYVNTPGNKSVRVWNKTDADISHFCTVTEWQDLDAVKAFAGEDHEKAKYYPEDEGILLEFEDTVSHYNSVDASKEKINYYIRQFEQVYKGGSWQGESFLEKLSGMDEEVAFRQPMPGVHSVAEVVWHCIYWRTTLQKRIEGDATYRDRTYEQLNFLSWNELKLKGWATLKQELDDSQNVLLTLLDQKRDNFLSTLYQPDHAFEHLVEGIVQHDVYHLGQIGLIKKMITM